MKKILAVIFLFVGLYTKAQNVYIPDSNFKAALLANWTINTNGDNQIQVIEANAFTGKINVYNKIIHDLTGIGAFTQLDSLDCSFNYLDTLDLSANTTLTSLDCQHNQLTSLDLTGNTALSYLNCDFNQLTSLNLSSNTALTYLKCRNNQLDSLDFTTTTALTYLECRNNNLTSLDLSANTFLTHIESQNNQLLSLDLPATTVLTFLNCYYNQLTSLDLSANTAITNLNCYHNQITNLDLSANTVIYELDCSLNQLTSLDLSANTAITTLDCSSNQLTSLDVSTNTALTLLSCSWNQITSLDLSTNTAITTLDCSLNQLTSLDLSTNIALTSVACYVNQLTSLDLSANAAITDLSCGANQFTSLDLSANTAITYLNCYNGHLTSLDLSANSALRYLYCLHNQITSLDLSANTAIAYLACDYNKLINLNLKNGNNSSLISFDARYNPNLACIDVDSLNYMNSHFGNYIDSSAVFSTNCSGIEPIQGTVYSDLNANCNYDSTDTPLGNVHLKLYDTTNVLVNQLYTKASGFYRFNVPVGIYKVVLDTTGSYTFQCPQPGIDTTLSTSFADSTNFNVICKEGFDLYVHSITNTGLVFPGQQHNMNINAGDASQWNDLNCSSGIGGTVVITYGGPVSYGGSAAGALVPVVSGNTLTYTIPDFGTITNSTAFAILLNTNTNAVIGDSVCITASITPFSGTETNSGNNTLHLCYAVRNSYDPNTKESYPKTVLPGYHDYFTYKVNFQNTGTAQAFTIKVIDTLAANLDLNTFELLSYSHACEVSIAGNILTANFENINLADSTTNEAASHGYFQYRIKPLPNMPNGTHIKNTAHIFFDFNPAVATNTTINSFQLPNSINELQENEVSIYPNPGTGLFTVSSKSAKDANLKISNVLGEMVYQVQLQKNKAALIDLSLQPKGIYVLRIEEEGKRFLNKKIVIQ